MRNENNIENFKPKLTTLIKKHWGILTFDIIFFTLIACSIYIHCITFSGYKCIKSFTYEYSIIQFPTTLLVHVIHREIDNYLISKDTKFSCKILVSLYIIDRA